MSWDDSKDIVLFVLYLMLMLNIVQWCRLLGSWSSREWWLWTSLETAWWCFLTHSSLKRASQQIMLSSALPFGWMGQPRKWHLKGFWRTTWPSSALWVVLLDLSRDVWPFQGPIVPFYPLPSSPIIITHFRFGWP